MLRKYTFIQDFWSIHYFDLFHKQALAQRRNIPRVEFISLTTRFKGNASVGLTRFFNYMFFSRSKFHYSVSTGTSRRHIPRKLTCEFKDNSLPYTFLVYTLCFKDNNAIFPTKLGNSSIICRRVSAFSVIKYYSPYHDSEWNFNISLRFSFKPNDTLLHSIRSLFKFYEIES